MVKIPTKNELLDMASTTNVPVKDLLRPAPAQPVAPNAYGSDYVNNLPRGYRPDSNSYDVSDAFSDMGDSVLGAFGFGESASERAIRRYQDALTNTPLPQLQNIDYTPYTEAGDYRNYVNRQGPTAFNKISIDPRLKDAQYNALAQMRDIADSGGLTAEDKALLSDIDRQEAAKERGSRGAILQNAQARGVGGSGLELMDQLVNSQNAATRRSSQDLDVAALAQKRALDAIRGTAELGGNLRGQEYGEAADKASAQDIINRFNSGQMTSAGFNTLQNKQNVGNMNVGLTNTAKETNRLVPLTNYQNQVNRLGQIASASQGRAGLADARNAGSFVGQVAGVPTSFATGFNKGAGSAGEYLGSSVLGKPELPEKPKP